MSFPKMQIKSHAASHGIFFSEEPEQQLASRFIDAVMANPEDAWAFVCEVYSGPDLNELRDILMSSAKIKVSEALYLSNSKICATRSLYVENPELNLRRMLHLRMVKDGGAWKIFGVEQEECRKTQ